MIDMQTFVNLGLVVVFVLVGGVFAATEIALVSLRESQVNQLEQRGGRGERVASIARDPNRFLSAVQIGVTVAGFFSAAYGGSTLAPDLAPYLIDLGLDRGRRGHGRAGPDDAADRLPLAGARRARAEAAGTAAVDAGWHSRRRRCSTGSRP